MQKKLISLLLLFSLVLTMSVPTMAKKQPPEVLISATSKRQPVSENLYGLSLEGTTTSLETGLYANFVYNSSFEEVGPSATLPGWELFGAYTIETEEEEASKRHKYLILPEGKKQKIKNLGFCEENMQTKSKKGKKACKASMGIEAGEGYIFSAFMKNTNTIVTVCLENEKGEKLSETNTFIVTVGSQWEKFTFPLSAAKTDYGYLSIEFAGGPVSIDNVSLMPADSFGLKDANWPNVALRKDLFDALYDAHPSFLRIPVACSTKGNISSAPSWKRTVGPLTERVPVPALSSEDVLQYNSSRAIGYHEMLQLAENVGANPVPVINIDALYKVQPIQAESTETTTEEETTTSPSKENKESDKKQKEEETTIVPIEPLEETPQQKVERFEKTLYMPHTQEWQNFAIDILDMLLYAKGEPAASVWSQKRAENGHEKPFSMTQLVLESQEVKDDVYLYATSCLKETIETLYPDVHVLIASDFTYEEILKEKEQNKKEESTENKGEEATTQEIVQEKSFESKETTSRPLERTPATYQEWQATFPKDSIITLQGNQPQEDMNAFIKAMREQPTEDSFASWAVQEYTQIETGHGKIQKISNLGKAMAEAIWMITAEQNSDIFSSMSIGPFFTRMDTPNTQSGLVLFNAHASVRTPSFLAQQLFANHRGKETIEAKLPETAKDLIQSVSIDKDKEVIYVKLVNIGDTQDFSYRLEGFEPIQYADVLSISSSKSHAYNDIGNTRVHIQKTDALASNVIPISIPNNSVSVLRIAYGNNKADENLYKLPKTVEPTRRYTTEEKTIFSSILAGTVALIALTYGGVRFWKYKKKSKQS